MGSTPTPEIRTDCRHYRGDRPCFPGYICSPDCDRFAVTGSRVLIIKLAALGDVVRTTPLLRTLPTELGTVHITWVTDQAALPLLVAGGLIDRVFASDDPFLAHLLRVEQFDLALCLDKEPRACALLTAARARSKRGFLLSERGAVEPATASANYLWRLGLDDDEKFRRNQRSYPQLMHEAIDIPYRGERYALPLPPQAQARAVELLAAAGADSETSKRGPLIGFQVGAGEVFANKAWTPAGMAKVIQWLDEKKLGIPVLLGGEREQEALAEVKARAAVPLVDIGTRHDIVTFAAIVARIDLLVTGDTLAMHLAIAAQRWVVAVFGPTCAQEIDLFGRGRKIVTPLSCSPCYRRSCDIAPSCMDSIAPALVLAAIEEAAIDAH